jgi:diketogulonate reductase-like aldo/keto reductase
VILWWLIQRDVVTIPKSGHPERIAQHFAMFDFTLLDTDMAAIATLATNISSFLITASP